MAQLSIKTFTANHQVLVLEQILSEAGNDNTLALVSITFTQNADLTIQATCLYKDTDEITLSTKSFNNGELITCNNPFVQMYYYDNYVDVDGYINLSTWGKVHINNFYKVK